MVKNILLSATIMFILGSFQKADGQKSRQTKKSATNSKPEFLDNIDMNLPSQNMVSTIKWNHPKDSVLINQAQVTVPSYNVESANSLQFKFAQLLNIEVEQVINLPLFKVIDEWLGTRYRMGGISRNGIDCSAFIQKIFTAIYGINLPRTAKEQYFHCQKVSRTELKEGDLVFFNTKGGISHVGMYLCNNKFVHASSSGVTISDLFEDYWVHRFIGVGRLRNLPGTSLASLP